MVDFQPAANEREGSLEGKWGGRKKRERGRRGEREGSSARSRFSQAGKKSKAATKWKGRERDGGKGGGRRRRNGGRGLVVSR